MKNRLPLVLSVTALVLAVLGFTPLGEAARNAIPPFARNADKVDGIDAARTAQAGKLLALSGSRKFPRSVFPVPFAGPRGPAGPAGAQGPVGPPGPAGAAGVVGPGGITAVKVVTGASAATTSSTTGSDLPGAATTIDIPTGQTGQILATFSGESACYGGVGSCSLRILVDGVEIQPQAAGDYAFDSSDNNTETSASSESHAVQRISNTLGAGSHSVLVQWAVSGAGTFRLDDWLFAAQLVRVT